MAPKKASVRKSAKTSASNLTNSNNAQKTKKKVTSRKVGKVSVRTAQKGKAKKRDMPGKESTSLTKKMKVEDKKKDTFSESGLLNTNPVSIKVQQLKSQISEVRAAKQKQLMDVKRMNKEALIRSQNEVKDLRKEIKKLKGAIKEKSKDGTKKNKEVMNLRAEASKEAYKIDESMKTKEVRLNRMINDIKQMEKAMQSSDDNHKKTMRILEEGLRENNKRDLQLRAELKCRLTDAESAQSKCQLALEKVQSNLDVAQKNFNEIITKCDTSEKKVETLEKKLMIERKAKMYLESEVKKKSAELIAVMRKAESETTHDDVLVKENDLAETILADRLTLMKEKVLEAEEKFEKNMNLKLTLEMEVKELVSQLQIAWKAVNNEKNLVKKGSANAKRVTEEARKSEQVLREKKEAVDKKLSALEKQYNNVVNERQCLELQVTKMADVLLRAEDKNKNLALTLTEGMKGRLQLGKMIDEARHAQAKAENALKTMGTKSSKEGKDLKAQVAELELKWQEKFDVENEEHEA